MSVTYECTKNKKINENNQQDILGAEGIVFIDVFNLYSSLRIGRRADVSCREALFQTCQTISRKTGI